jgi:hypothetical protein
MINLQDFEKQGRIVQISVFPELVTKQDFLKSIKGKEYSHVGAVYYPHWAGALTISLKRFGLKPRVIYEDFLSDGVSGAMYGIKAKKNTKPDEIEVEDTKIMEFSITKDEASEEFISLAKRKSIRKYRTWWMPEVILERCIPIYIKYWVGKKAGCEDVFFCNSFSGEKGML